MPLLIRSACLTNYAEVAAATGLDVPSQLKAVGLDASCLASPDKKIPVDAVALLLENSARDAGIEDFGLRMAETRQLENLGPIALVAREEPTVRKALIALQRYLRLHNEALTVLIEESSHVVVIREEQMAGRPVPVRQATELTVAVLFRALRVLLGTGWAPQSVRFSHDPPADLGAHLRIFGPRVQFSGEFDGIVCRPADLEQPIPTADTVTAGYLREYLDAMLAKTNHSTEDKVRQLVWVLLPTGNCSVELIAKHLNMDRRTVHRHLAEHDATFLSVVDDIRAELVARHLANRGRSLSDVAELLGFSSLSAFSRWFSGRFGCSATAWRQEAGKAG